jgi:hypothetical protein
MITIIATYQQDCEIFKKDYKPKIVKPAVIAPIDVDNKDGFFDNLPALTTKKDLKGNRTIWAHETNSVDAKVQKAKEVI